MEAITSVKSSTYNRLSRVQIFLDNSRGEYPVIVEFAEQAKAEGFTQIAALFEAVGAIEKEHEARYRKLLANIEGDCVFSKDGDVIWECANCGHIVVGKKAPEVCPVCQHPQSYFQVKAENY